MHAVTEALAKAAKEKGAPVLAVSVGSGQIAQYAVDAGADALLALNAGIYRGLGRGSLASLLAYGNANEQTEELLRRHILPNARNTPVVAGVMASDPTLELVARLERLKRLGVQGITNWPTMGFIDGKIREAFEEDGLGIEAEFDLMRRAAEMGFATFAFALSVEDARRFARCNVDALIINAGLTPLHFAVGDRRDQLQEALAHIDRMVVASELPGRQPLRLVYGGPFTDLEDFTTLFGHAKIDGIAGGSVFERLPVQAITYNFIRRCKALRMAEPPGGEATPRQMVGQSQPFRDMVAIIEKAAPHDVSVVIEGETGVGKELAASLIHELSPRAKQPLITLNCGAIPPGLLESELFGHERGAFTGADRRRIGKFELANRGTLLLDEIADLSPAAQVALLRVLQQREVTRVGADIPIPLNVRVIAATNRSLAELVSQGKFRSDLYYRLSTITIEIPPLRERKQDVLVLANAFLKKVRAEHGGRTISLDTGFEDRLVHHDWPGNIRELHHVLSRAVILEGSPILRGLYFKPGGAQSPSAEELSVRRSISPQEVLDAVTRFRGNKSHAANHLRISRKTLYAKLREARPPDDHPEPDSV
jgi:DNA-binding NtrC family response regulator/predicted TIM-barrel enzyme